MLQHLAIIMDGNRRWAQSHMLPAFAWHKAGADNVVRVTELADEKWITHLTLWALSTENLEKRNKEEVAGIIKLVNSVQKYLDRMKVKSLKFQTIGDISKLPQESQKVLQDIIDTTSSNTGITVTLWLIYWGQDEILRATKKILKAGIDPDTLTHWEFRKYLDTSILPLPDVIVRTWWDIRHSWFLLYDSAYSEYFFTEKCWPWFDESELDLVIEKFNNAQRNFWK